SLRHRALAASGNNDRLSTPWREVISIAGVARSFSKASSCRNLGFSNRHAEPNGRSASERRREYCRPYRDRLTVRPIQLVATSWLLGEMEVSTTDRAEHPAPATRLDRSSFRRFTRCGRAPIGMLFALVLAGCNERAQSQAAAPPPAVTVAQP